MAGRPSGPGPHLVQLDDHAKRLFVRFYNANGAALATADEGGEAAMSKLEWYALRLALVFHCCRLKRRAKDVPIGAADMKAAIRLTGWFRDETLFRYAEALQEALRG